MAASVLLRPGPAAADNGNPLLLGETNSAESETAITSTNGHAFAATNNDLTVNFSALSGVDNSPGGFGVSGSSVHGTGVDGTTTGGGQAGVSGADTSSSGGYGVKATSVSGTGVGASSGTGTGVQGTTAERARPGCTGAITAWAAVTVCRAPPPPLPGTG